MSDNLTWLSDYYGDLFGQTLIHFLKGGLICSPAEYLRVEHSKDTFCT